MSIWWFVGTFFVASNSFESVKVDEQQRKNESKLYFSFFSGFAFVTHARAYRRTKQQYQAKQETTFFFGFIFRCVFQLLYVSHTFVILNPLDPFVQRFTRRHRPGSFAWIACVCGWIYLALPPCECAFACRNSFFFTLSSSVLIGVILCALTTFEFYIHFHC